MLESKFDGQLPDAALHGEVLGAALEYDGLARYRTRSAAIAAKHPTLLRALHWASVLAIVVAVSAMFLRDAVENPALRGVLLETHRELGLAVLLFAGVRMVHRLALKFSDHAVGMRPVLRLAAQGAHLMLYGLLLALPLTGWALTSAHDIPLGFLGIVHLPKLVAADSEFADTLADYHVWLAWALLAAVALHVAAALWHHFVRRDAVLSAMLPGKAAHAVSSAPNSSAR